MPFFTDKMKAARETRQEQSPPAAGTNAFTPLGDGSPFENMSPFADDGNASGDGQDLYRDTFGEAFTPAQNPPSSGSGKKEAPVGSRVTSWASQMMRKGKALTGDLLRRPEKTSSPTSGVTASDGKEMSDAPWGGAEPASFVPAPSWNEPVPEQTKPSSEEEDGEEDGEEYGEEYGLLYDLRLALAAFRKRLPSFKPKEFSAPESSYEPEEDNIKSPTLAADIQAYIARERDFGETQREYDRMRAYIRSVNTDARPRRGDIPAPSNLNEVRAAENEIFEMIRQIDRRNEEQRGRIGVYEPPPEPDPYNYRGINDDRQNYADIEAATFSMQPRVSFESEQRIDPGRAAAEEALRRQWEAVQNATVPGPPSPAPVSSESSLRDEWLPGDDDLPPVGEPSAPAVQPAEEQNPFAQDSPFASDDWPPQNPVPDTGSNRRRFGRRTSRAPSGEVSQETREEPAMGKNRFVSHMPPQREEDTDFGSELAQDFAENFPEAAPPEEPPRKARKVAVRRRNAPGTNMDDR